MYRAIQGANSVLKHSFEKKDAVSPLKLQKLVYFIHGWHLALFDVPILSEDPEVWPWGPVFPEVYHDCKIFGSVPIVEQNWKQYGTPHKGDVPQTDDKFHRILQEVWNLYAPHSAMNLSDLTHAHDTPWSSANKRGDQFLDQEEIRQHFKSLQNA